MSEKAQVFKYITENSFDSLEKTIGDLTIEEIKWKPVPEYNDIDWILIHLTKISIHLLPAVIDGKKDSITKAWSSQTEKEIHTLEEMQVKITEAKNMLINGISELTDMELYENIPIWGGNHPRKEGLATLLGEISHHTGQIAYLKGTYRRHKGNNK